MPRRLFWSSHRCDFPEDIQLLIPPAPSAPRSPVTHNTTAHLLHYQEKPLQLPPIWATFSAFSMSTRLPFPHPHVRSNRRTLAKYLPGFLHPPRIDTHLHIFMEKQRASPQCAASETQTVHCQLCLLLITCNFKTRMQKKVLPGKDWLVHMLPGLQTAPCANSCTKSSLLLPAMD